MATLPTALRSIPPHPATRNAVRFLEEHVFPCIEKSWDHSISLDDYDPAEQGHPCVARIFRHSFDQFRAVYHPDSDTYWTPDRLLSAIDDWLIFVYKQADFPIAAIFLTGKDEHWEIYGSAFSNEAFDEQAFRELLETSLVECRRRGARYLTYFSGEPEKPTLADLGSRCIGQYVLFARAL